MRLLQEIKGGAKVTKCGTKRKRKKKTINKSIRLKEIKICLTCPFPSCPGKCELIAGKE